MKAEESMGCLLSDFDAGCKFAGLAYYIYTEAEAAEEDQTLLDVYFFDSSDLSSLSINIKVVTSKQQDIQQ